MGLTCSEQMASRSAVASRRKESTSGRGGGGENFKVAVRVRPLIERELRTGAPQVNYWRRFLSGGTLLLIGCKNCSRDG